MFFTYVLQSLKSGKRYIGSTKNLENRIHEHNSGFVTATKSGKPWKIIYYEACLDKTKAIKREKYFKTGFGRKFLNGRI